MTCSTTGWRQSDFANKVINEGITPVPVASIPEQNINAGLSGWPLLRGHEFQARMGMHRQLINPALKHFEHAFCSRPWEGESLGMERHIHRHRGERKGGDNPEIATTATLGEPRDANRWRGPTRDRNPDVIGAQCHPVHGSQINHQAVGGGEPLKRMSPERAVGCRPWSRQNLTAR